MPIPKGQKDVRSDSPTVRLAVGGNERTTGSQQRIQAFRTPTVRLVAGCDSTNRQSTSLVQKSPLVRLAHKPGAQGDNNLIGVRGVEQLPRASWPALLVSYVYLETFLEKQASYAYRDWVMDSGAFSAHMSGAAIDLDEYIEVAKRLKENDPTLSEVFALDVIGDWKGSLQNTERMWANGVEAIPCFHYGEPWDILKSLCRDYPKVAIGGCVGRRDKDEFARQCFARVWPKKLHGFGFGSEKSLMLCPWHSVDATNWETGPCKFGRWNAFGGSLSVRGSSQNLRAEVEWYLELERKAREWWKKEMLKLGEDDSPTVRLAADANSGGGQPLTTILKKPQ